jgi:hypothetical protein
MDELVYGITIVVIGGLILHFIKRFFNSRNDSPPPSSKSNVTFNQPTDTGPVNTESGNITVHNYNREPANPDPNAKLTEALLETQRNAKISAEEKDKQISDLTQTIEELRVIAQGQGVIPPF